MFVRAMHGGGGLAAPEEEIVTDKQLIEHLVRLSCFSDAVNAATKEEQQKKPLKQRRIACPNCGTIGIHGCIGPRKKDAKFRS